MKTTRAIGLAAAVVFTAGCFGSGHGSAQPIPTNARALALFNGDVAAAVRHDEASLCASADYGPAMCHDQLQSAGGWPRLANVRYTSIRVVDTARVLHVCGTANGQQFASDFPVINDDGLRAINPLFWMPMDYIHNPGEGSKVSASPGQTAPPVTC